MDVFSFFKKKKAELTDEQKKWNRMWDLWVEGRADSPYAELMTYQGEINNGGHVQYFFNIENTDDLQRNMAVLETVLPAKLQENLRKAYNACIIFLAKKGIHGYVHRIYSIYTQRTFCRPSTGVLSKADHLLARRGSGVRVHA